MATDYRYNGFGELIEQSSPDTKTSTFQYDQAGNRIVMIDARSVTIHYRYDALNRLIASDYPGTEEDIEYVYDQGVNGIGRLTAIDDANGHIDYQYDARGNLIEETRQIDLDTGSVTLTTGYAYDKADNLIQVTYPDGSIVNYVHNALSQIQQIKLNEQALADNIQYQPFGPLSQLIYSNGITENRTYDLDYRLQNIDVPGVHGLSYQYDSNGNIRDVQNLLNTGQNQSFGYDTLDRLLTAQGGYGDIGYGYDPVGNRLSLTQDTAVENYSYGVDSHHLLERGDIQYQYDAVGNTLHNAKFAFTYNQANRLSLVHDFEGKQVAEYYYNALGQRTIKVVGTESPDYAALADEQDALAEQYRSEANAKQDRADALEAQATQNEQQALANQEEAETLRQEAIEDRAAADALEPQIAELEAEAQPWVERADRFRDRIVEPPQHIRDRMRNAAFSLVAGVFQAVADVYLDQAEALRTEAETLRDGADAKEQQAATLDNEATQLLVDAEQARQDAQVLRAEAMDLIVLAEQAEAQAAEYRALAENPPETKTTTIFIYDLSGQLIGEYDEQGNTIREYVWLNDMPIVMIQNGETYFIHADHLNTPIALTDQNQSIVWKAEYKPFGEVNEIVNTVEFNLRRPGQYFDQETGLSYNWNRYYDPSTGRYITSDPIGLSGGLNTYLYANANPIRFTDPNGLLACPGGEWSTTGLTSESLFFGGGVATSSTTFTCESNKKKCEATTLCFGGGIIAAAGIGGDMGSVSGVTNSNQFNTFSSGVYVAGGPVSVVITGNSKSTGIGKSWGAGVAYVTCIVLQPINCDEDCEK